MGAGVGGNGGTREGGRAVGEEGEGKAEGSAVREEWGGGACRREKEGGAGKDRGVRRSAGVRGDKG